MLATQAMQLEPRDVDARLTLARALTQKKQYAEALKILDELVASTPNVAAVHAQRGTLLARKRDHAGARAAFERALQVNPTEAEALDGITGVDFAAGRQSEAIARLEALVQRGSEQVAVRMAAARAYATASRFGEAETHLLKVIEAAPSHPDAYAMLGTIYLQQNRVAAARTQFEKVVAKQPRSLPGWTVIGTIDLMEARIPDAQRSFERVLEINPKSGVAANNLAWIYAENGGSLDAALQLAQVASRELPDDAEVSDTLGWIYYKKGMIELSIATLRRSLEIDPQNPHAAYHLALAYDKRGDRDLARQMLSRYLTIDSTSARSAEVKRRLEAGTGT